MATKKMDLYLELFAKNFDKLIGAVNQVEKLGKKTDQARKKTQGLNSVFKGLVGFAIFQKALQGVKNFVGGVISATIQMESIETSFAVMLKGSANAARMLKDVKKAASESNFTFLELLQTTKMYLAMGIKQKDIVKYLKMTGDIAAGLGVPLQRLGLVFGQVRSKGKLMGDDLKQFTEMGVPMIEELSKKYHKNGEAIRSMVSKGKIGFKEVESVMKDLTSEGGRFYNMQIKLASTMGGLMSILKDYMFQMSANIGKAFLKTMKSVLTTIKKKMGQIQESLDTQEAQDFLAGMGQGLEDFFLGIFAFIGEVITALKPFFLMFIIGLRAIALGFKTIMDSGIGKWAVRLATTFLALRFTVRLLRASFVSLTRGMKLLKKSYKRFLVYGRRFTRFLKLQALWTKIVTVAQGIWNAVTMAFPLVWILMGIALVVAAVAGMIVYWDKFKEVLGKVYKTILKSRILKWGTMLVAGFYAIRLAIGLTRGAINLAVGSLNLLKNTYKSLIVGGGKFLKFLKLQRLGTLLAAGAQWLLNIATYAFPLTWIVAGIAAFIAILGSLVYYWDDVVDALSDTWFFRNLGSYLDWLADKFDWVVKLIVDAFDWVWDQLKDSMIMDFIRGIGDAIDWVAKKLSGFVSGSTANPKKTDKEKEDDAALEKIREKNEKKYGKDGGDKKPKAIEETITSGDESADARRLEQKKKNNDALLALQEQYKKSFLDSESKLMKSLAEKNKMSDDEIKGAKAAHLQAMADLRKKFDDGTITQDQYMAELEALELEKSKTASAEAFDSRAELIQRKKDLDMEYAEGKISSDQYMTELEELRKESDLEALDAYYEAQLEKQGLSQEAKIELKQQHEDAKSEINIKGWLDYTKMNDKQLTKKALRKIGADKKQMALYETFHTEVLSKSKTYGKAQAALQKGQAIATATIETYKMAVSAFSALAPIPFVGPALGVAAAAGAIALGMENVNQIRSTEPGFAVGATKLPTDITGATLHAGEMIIPKTFAQGIRDGDAMLGDTSKLAGNGENSPINNNSIVENNFDGATFNGQMTIEEITAIFEVAGKEMAEARLSPLPTKSITR